MNALELNETLHRKTISRIEPGTTPGWVVIFFENNDPSLTDDEGKPVELFMTIFVGGSKFDDEESLYHSNCALHLRAKNGCSTCHNIRDYSTPMPMAAADTITLKGPALCDAPDVGQRSRYGHCTNRVAENGMLCQEHYEQSQLCLAAEG
jgi:hypothetical protein